MTADGERKPGYVDRIDDLQSKFPLSEPCIEDEQNQKDITAGINDADVDKLMPPVSRFGGGNWAEKKQGIIEKLMRFFERFFGIA